MTAEEIIRRVRALISMAPRDRPISIDRLAQVAGMHEQTIYGISMAGQMAEQSRSRLERALRWVENDQIEVRRRANKPSVVRIRAPQPPQENLTAVEMTKAGPRVRFQSVNPRAFPHRRRQT